MSEITVDNIEKIDPSDLDDKGTYLYLLHADKIPPHLGIISYGKDYNLSAKGNVVGEPMGDLLRLIKVKKIPTLLISVDGRHDLDMLDEEFNMFKKAIPGTVTCLQPVKSYFGRALDINTFGVQYVFELIPLLQAEGKIKGAYQMHLDDEVDNGRFALRTYSKKEIDDRIKAVRDKK